MTTPVPALITLGATSYRVEARDGLAGRSYILHPIVGGKGQPKLATQAYIGDDHTFKVLTLTGRNGLNEYRFRGNRILLNDADGVLRVR